VKKQRRTPTTVRIGILSIGSIGFLRALGARKKDFVSNLEKNRKRL
jgi:hypothetical protein